MSINKIDKRARAARTAALLAELEAENEAKKLPVAKGTAGAGGTQKVVAPARDGHSNPDRKKRTAKQRLDPEQEAEAVSGPSPHEPDGQVVADSATGVLERHWPKNHEHGSVKRGDSVWYRGERWWVEFANTHWSKGCYVRIVDKAVHPDPIRPLPSDLEDPRILSFCVHADLLSLAPVRGGLYTQQPSLAGVARAERAKAGIKDVGDDVALLLRECKGIDEVYAAAAKYLGLAEQTLRDKYGHLNPGQQRMNCGNKMRAFWRKNNGK